MHPQLTTLLHAAETQYLELEDLEKVQNHVNNLNSSVEVYNLVRDNEIEIFQNIADKLVKEFSQTEELTIELVLSNWLVILRYCAMAMMTNNYDLLTVRLLEWLKDVVQAHQNLPLESRTYQLLGEQLSEVLSREQFMLLNPFLETANNTIFAKSEVVERQGLN
jgi:hypothetical protein